MRLQKENSQRTPDGKKKILLVDDDSMVGNTAQEILEYFGYRVDFRIDPVEALNHFQRNPYGFDLIVTDMTMPLMTGRELALEIMKVREDIPVIVCTGHSVAFSEKEAAQMGVKAVVMKPLTMALLKETIHRVIEGVQKLDGETSVKKPETT
jgi:DNA-binding NtrC family response regulator